MQVKGSPHLAGAGAHLFPSNLSLFDSAASRQETRGAASWTHMDLQAFQPEHLTLNTLAGQIVVLTELMTNPSLLPLSLFLFCFSESLSICSGFPLYPDQVRVIRLFASALAKVVVVVVVCVCV